MKQFPIAVMFLCASAGVAFAAQVEWLGYYCITNPTLSTACLDDGIGVGECEVLRYAPPNVGTNGPSTRFSIFGQHWAENYTLPAGSLSTEQTVNGTGIAKGVWTFVSQMKNVTNPALPVATTKNITMSGYIHDFDGATGCDINFRAAATLRP